MESSPTLVVMAAGVGSRFGGLKQLEPVGPSGEVILDYSIHDALAAGFSRLVFVIRSDMEQDFRDRFGRRVEAKADTRYVFQELDALPEGFAPPEGRTKPWGTGQAILCCRDQIDGPFAVINADDFYGQRAYQLLADWMGRLAPAAPLEWSMVGYVLGNTLSDHGYVSRGVCRVDDRGFLEEVREHTRIERRGGAIQTSGDEGESWDDLPHDATVSMNMWGFTPELFPRLEERFAASELLLEQQFISEDEFKRDEIELLRASSRLEQSILAKETYEKYDRSMQLERLNADIQRAEDKLRETRERQVREIEAEEREVQNRRFRLQRQREDLEKARRQLDMCSIYAPQDGLVVYASSLSRDRRGDNDVPEVGTELRRNRTVIVLPDTTRMVAEVKVNEALSGRIRAGQPAVVRVEAMPNVPLVGEVLGVGVLAESGGWRDPNRREYTVRIAIEADPELGLKPSMRCRAQVEIGSVVEALHVPIQAVFRDGRLAYVWTKGDAGGFKPTPVQLGRASELMIEIRGGLESGEQVLLRQPRADEIVRSIDELKQEIEAQQAEARSAA